MTDAAVRKIAHDTSFTVLGVIGLCHLLNDMMQSLLPAIYPTLKEQFHLNFAQIGLVTLAFQCTASLFQPVVGYFADLKPMRDQFGRLPQCRCNTSIELAHASPAGGVHTT